MPQTPAELAEAAIAAAEGREPKPDAAEAARLAELTPEAEAAGVTVEQLRGARLAGMSPSEYVAWDRPGGVSITEVGEVEAEAEAERKARRQAEHERLVAKVKERLP
jgi:hypothetical protein